SLSELASRAGTGAPALDLLAWSGACDSLVLIAESPAVAGPLAVAEPPFLLKQDDNENHSHYDSHQAGFPDGTRPHISPRRLVLWQLGVAMAARGVAGGDTQLALPLKLPDAPALRELPGWEAMLADYRTLGMTVTSHPMALLRSRLPAGSIDSRELVTLAHGSRVRIGGLVVARQRPGTAGGVVFVLLEDEFGVVNLIVPPAVYERHRLTVRTEPLLLVEGRLERHAQASGAINVLVNRVDQIAAPGGLVAQVQDFSAADERVRAEEQATAAGDVDEFRAVAPPVMSFAAGRRR
ncbi:MAG TPA: OB-fold nucleic acid binding domain-containing protein, partial [Acidothermaceae bacterium]|nr:OB-fold nucleic acid binding domain-containing protein [Acidothermaceae bacterium]